jgi:hypothetical protein
MRAFVLIPALALAVSSGAMAQNRTASSGSATPADRDVYASTSGTGSSTPDSVQVGGTADARASDGGTASTNSTARFKNNRGNQRSVANARDDDERARSHTHTIVRPNGEVTSRSFSKYKEQGEKPIIDRDVSRSSQ